jgi:hypothetical protein
MKRLLSLILLGLVLFGARAEAQLLGDVKSGFSADRTVVFDGRTFTGRVYAIPGRQRHEQAIEGIPQVILLRSDGKGWLVLPTMRSYVEFGMAPALAELADPGLLGTPVGKETVNGIATTKYRIEHTARDGTTIDGYLWRSADGLVMKLDGYYTPRNGRATPVQMELSHVERGRQDPALFELPQGMVRLPTNALQPLLGLGRAG